jgi:GMP synthase (glutamine-hydrolysing)
VILIVDLCYRENSLSKEEFVGPIAKIVEGSAAPYTVVHYSRLDRETLDAAERVILCGTALKDDGFAACPGSFQWILTCGRPVMGICAGMEAIALAAGLPLVEMVEIGTTTIRVVANDPLFTGREAFEAYSLHHLAIRIVPPFEPVATSTVCVQAIRHSTLPIYGVLFHPEVRNEWVVTRFIEIPNKT